jgi:hypothetical protein
MDSVLSKAWARMVIPSFSDLFFLAAMAFLFMGAYGWTGLLADGDAGWHIRTGEYILDHHSVPYQDLYSFSKPGSPWYAWEWGSDIIYASLFRAFGLKGVVLLAGLLIAFFATTLVRRTIRRGTHLFIAVLVALLGVGASTLHFLARPHVFTLVLLSISMWLLERDRDAGNSGKAVWWLVPISMVWTNLHGGFLILIALLGVAAAGAAVEALLTEGKLAEKNWTPAIRYAALAGASALVSLVNPYGWGLHKHVVEYLRSDWIRNVVQEFQSPSFRGEGMLQFEVLLFVGLMAAGSLLRRRRVVEGAWLLFCAYLSLSSARHIPVFLAVTVPLIATEINDWWDRLTEGSGKNSLPGILNAMSRDSIAGFRRTSILPFAVIAVLVAVNEPIQWPKDFPKELFPLQMVHAHESQILQSRILTTDQWADYLIFVNPKQKVFMDGRSDFYGKEIGTQLLDLSNGTWKWKQIMSKYNFDLALLPVELPLVQLLKQDPTWQVLADDGKSILLAPKVAPVLPTSILRP